MSDTNKTADITKKALKQADDLLTDDEWKVKVSDEIHYFFEGQTLDNDQRSKKFEPIFLKFITCLPYDPEDIKFMAEVYLEKNEVKIDEEKITKENIYVATDIKELNKAPNRKIVFIFFRLDETSIWTLISVHKPKNVVFFIDPRGKEMSPYLVDMIKLLIHADCEVVCYKFNNLVDENLTRSKAAEMMINIDDFSGPIVMRNWGKILEKCNGKYFDYFPKLIQDNLFCKLNEILQIKVKLATENCRELAKDLSFRAALTEFFEGLKSIKDLSKTVAEHVTQRQNFINGKIKEPVAYKTNELEKIRDFLLEKDSQRYVLKLKHRFGTQTEALRKLFMVLHQCSNSDGNLESSLKQVAGIFDIKVDYLKGLLDSNPFAETSGKVGGNISFDNSERARRKINQKRLKKVEDLVSELLYPSEYREKILDIYRSAMTVYKRKSKKSTLGYLKQELNFIKTLRLDSRYNLYRVLCFLIQAQKAITDYFFPAEILSFILYFAPKSIESKQARMFQVKNGGDRDVIVAMIAATIALQGHCVDIITFDEETAAKTAKKMEEFYSKMILAAGDNNYDAKTPNKPRYQHKIIYGTIANFQNDYLRDAIEGTNIRNRRPFHQLIIGDVDSVLLDHGATIAKLSEPYPGLDALRYVFLSVWGALLEEEAKFDAQLEKRIKEKVDAKDDQKYLKRFVERELDSKLKKLFTEMMKLNLDQNEMLPLHLEPYAKSKIESFIKTAIYAKYKCFENKHYRLIKAETDAKVGEFVIAPLDYKSTGRSLMGSSWPDGLLQFLQLKHNLCLTVENLASSFISNVGFVKKYKPQNIFGITATLGTGREREILSKICGSTECVDIPLNWKQGDPCNEIPEDDPNKEEDLEECVKHQTAVQNDKKKKAFQELPGLVVEDDYWHKEIVIKALDEIRKKRSVVIICASIDDIMILTESFKTAKKYVDDKFKVKPTYENRHFNYISDIDSQIVFVTTILITRKIELQAGRLEKFGGLHVIVGFLPLNKRIEDQAFGITALQGNLGSAQIIMRKTEVDSLKIKDPNPTILAIKATRDDLHDARTDDFATTILAEIDYKDALFDAFTEKYKIRRLNVYSDENYVNLRDIKEDWAFFMSKLTSDERNFLKIVKTAKVDDTIHPLLFDMCTGCSALNPRTKNPLYDLLRGSQVLPFKPDQAEEYIRRSLEARGGNSKNFDLFYAAHMKLFEATLEKSDTVYLKSQAVLDDMFMLNKREVVKNEGYMLNAQKHLENAEKSLKKEIDYIKKLLESDTFKLIITSSRSSFAHENFLYSHLRSKLICLNVFYSSVHALIEFDFTEDDELKIFDKKTNNFFDAETKFNSKIFDKIHSLEVDEFRSMGMEFLYQVRSTDSSQSTRGIRDNIFLILGVGLFDLFAMLPFFIKPLGFIGVGLLSEALVEYATSLMDAEFKTDRVKELAKDRLNRLLISYEDVNSPKTFVTNLVKYCMKILREMPNIDLDALSLETSDDKEKVASSLTSVADLAVEFDQKLHAKLESTLKNQKTSNPRDRLKKNITSSPIASEINSTRISVGFLRALEDKIKKIVKDQMASVSTIKRYLRHADTKTLGQHLDKIGEDFNKNNFTKKLSAKTLKDSIKSNDDSKFIQENSVQIQRLAKRLLVKVRDAVKKDRERNRSLNPIIETVCSKLAKIIMDPVKKFIENKSGSDAGGSLKKAVMEAKKLGDDSPKAAAFEKIARAGLVSTPVEDIAAIKDLNGDMLLQSIWAYAIALGDEEADGSAAAEKKLDDLKAKLSELKKKKIFQ